MTIWGSVIAALGGIMWGIWAKLKEKLWTVVVVTHEDPRSRQVHSPMTFFS